MPGKSFKAFGAVLLTIGWAPAASAQAAAETAVILSGTGQATGSASRSLGSAISGSINAASAQIQAARNGGSVANGGGRRRASGVAYAIPADVDMLEGTDAPTYRLGNGATIRVSGTFVQGAETSCAKDCPQDAGRRKANR
jgi:hypothetical protein